jgi:hypothetical protein
MGSASANSGLDHSHSVIKGYTEVYPVRARGGDLDSGDAFYSQTPTPRSTWRTPGHRVVIGCTGGRPEPS